MQTVIVWDIETVPDLEGFARANSLEGRSEAEVISVLGKGFPKPLYHSIVCIGILVAELIDQGWRVKSVSAPHVGEHSESVLIQQFSEQVADLRPVLVTYNGNGFDLPVLRYRAMLNKVSAPGFSSRPYFNRYTEDALDLCDTLSSFGSSTKMKLDEVCKFMGLDGKPNDINGSQVREYFEVGRIQEIADYCISDVVNTYRLWLRWELFKGNIDDAEFVFSDQIEA